MSQEALRSSFESPGRSSNRLADYQDRLGLDLEALKGKRILDVGCGPALFAIEATRLDLDVTSVDPRMPCILPGSMSPYEELRYRQMIDGGFIVKGSAQDLPFEDDSFDIVIAMQSVPAYLPKDDEVRTKAVDEILRVTAPGGEVRLSPVGFKQDSGDSYLPPLKLAKMLQDGLDLDFQPAPDKTTQRLTITKPIAP